MFLSNGRWRGIMPFRTALPLRKLYDQQKRTGEPFPSIIFHLIDDLKSQGHGKSQGSYTARFRQALWAWMKETTGNSTGPLTLDYQLHRHKVVTITGMHPVIRHNPHLGRGYKGFTLDLQITSIDGIPYRGIPGQPCLAWGRIRRLYALCDSCRALARL